MQNPTLTIRKISVGIMDNNVYLLSSRATGAQVLIDAASDAPAIFALLESASADLAPTAHAELVAVISTHSHWDHVLALAEIVSSTAAKTLAGASDAAQITVQTEVPIDTPVEHGRIVGFGDSELETIHLRGHTPGSIALLYRDPDGPARLFTGDSLFPGGVGNTEEDPIRFNQLIDDVQERIFDQLPDDTVVHPGHGAATTLGAERPQLATWRTRGW